MQTFAKQRSVLAFLFSYVVESFVQNNLIRSRGRERALEVDVWVVN
jgi:hypothetical protein